MNSRLLKLLALLLFSHFSCFLVIVPASAERVLLSMDCGSSSSKPYTDDNSIVWIGDGSYIQSGETYKVTIDAPDIKEWDSHVMSTLRAFPTRKKNCYSIDIDQDKAKDSTAPNITRVLVRASFYYGNYDGKLTPPSFNLQFSGNSWTQIVTDQDDIIYTEMVYSLIKGNNISICLAQTQPDNIPFISALEVRNLSNLIFPGRFAYSYVDSNYPVFFSERLAFAGANTTIRYPDDSFDRIWGPVHTNLRVKSNVDDNPLEALRKTLKELQEVQGVQKCPCLAAKAINDDEPPEGALRRTHLYSSGNMVYTGISDPKIPIHYNAYFTEVNILNSTEKRSFDILVNNKFYHGPIVPPREYLQMIFIRNVTSSADNSSHSISLVPTNDSTLPPLIIALEGFTIGNRLVQGTNSSDVYSLSLLQKSFAQLQDWSGDPCLPSPYTWDWVACNSDADSPRVTALHLNDFGLVGILPDLSAMDALEIIDLHNNSLPQEIPGFLGTLPKLKVLNLANNNFSGTMPSSLSNNVNLKLNASGNPNLLCTNTSICNTDTESNKTNTTDSSIPSPSNGESSKTLAQPIIILLLIITLSGFLLM